ncbi:MAG: RNA polymerase sigma factor [Acidobacteriota bacterium]
MQNDLSIEIEAEPEARTATPSAADAFEALFRQHQHAVCSWIRRIVRDRGVAEDLTIETFWRIHRGWPSFDAQRDFAPWARRIATRVALDWLRAQPRESPQPEEFFAGIAQPPAADAAIASETRRMVAQALRRLPAKLRIAALLAVVEKLPHKEIAAALGTTIGAVKVRVFRALRLLRRDLERQGIRP